MRAPSSLDRCSAMPQAESSGVELQVEISGKCGQGRRAGLVVGRTQRWVVGTGDQVARTCQGAGLPAKRQGIGYLPNATC